MTVSSLIDRLKVPRPHQPTPEKVQGVGAKIEPVTGENTHPTPPTPPTPKKVEGQNQNAEFVCRTPQNTEKSPGVPAQNTPVSLGEDPHRTPRTPGTPKKVEGQNQNAEFAEVAPVLEAPPPKPMPPFSVYAPWNVADNAYQNHHWQCQQCRVNARTRDREPRCATGQELYAAYELAAMKETQ